MYCECNTKSKKKKMSLTHPHFKVQCVWCNDTSQNKFGSKWKNIYCMLACFVPVLLTLHRADKILTYSEWYGKQRYYKGHLEDKKRRWMFRSKSICETVLIVKTCLSKGLTQPEQPELLVHEHYCCLWSFTDGKHEQGSISVENLTVRY